jgi:hypothetical protein
MSPEATMLKAMFKFQLNRLFGRPTVRCIPEQSAVLYREGSRRMEISGERSRDRFVIDLDSIVWWYDQPTQRLGDIERRRVAEAVKATIESQWGWTAQISQGR